MRSQHTVLLYYCLMCIFCTLRSITSNAFMNKITCKSFGHWTLLWRTQFSGNHKICTCNSISKFHHFVLSMQTCPFVLHSHRIIHKQDKQCKYNAILRYDYATIVAVEKHSECVHNLRYLAHNAHAPNLQLWPAPLYSSFLHYLINGKIKKKSVLVFLYNFCLKHFSY
jgi:hypothetical protein